MTLRFCSSVLMVEDISASRRFYEELLMQRVELDHGACVGFRGGFSIWHTEHAHKIIFGNNSNTPESGNKGHTFELYFETDELDKVYGILSKEGIPLVHDVLEQPWGQRVFRVYDPDRYIVEIGEPMTSVIKRYLDQGMTCDTIAVRTSMPLEIVRQVEKDLVK